MFENWNNLPEELKLECIKWMDLRTRFKLRRVSHSELNLVRNAQRLHIHEIRFLRKSNPNGFVVFIRHKWQTSVKPFAGFRGEEQPKNAIPFLSFVFQNCVFFRMSFTGSEEHDYTFLAEIATEMPYHIKEFEGDVPSIPLKFLQNCVPNSIQSIRLNYPRVYGKPFPVEELLNTPALQSTRKWKIKLNECSDLGVAIAKKWIEWDVECKCRLVFYHDYPERVVPSFLNKFGSVKILKQTETMVRFETPNPKKHILLRKDLSFALVMIAADLEENDYENYIFSPF